ncbi:acyl carrier protein [Fusobacterium sp.]|uniref:acyl carrier protein n=1 Tax=Fusobacterium sp. TaxID=68766 RepID=UPI002638F8F1|nr:phosphopantetheine-binding protein [Fusobacterium sp.]
MNFNQLEIIKKIVADQLDISISDITDDSDLFKDLGADSFDIANIVSEIEVKFDISIPYVETKYITLMKELLEHTDKKLK